VKERDQFEDLGVIGKFYYNLSKSIRMRGAVVLDLSDSGYGEGGGFW
jgi:hypothetical protein